MIKIFSRLIERYFALMAILSFIIALIYPEVFIRLKSHLSILLGIIMFGMGITLNFQDFKGVWELKRFVISGIIMQYTIMPILAVLISLAFRLPTELAAGLIIVGACPSGTASNVMTYMAKANLALSVTLTFFTTLTAPFITPMIIYIVLNKFIYIPYWSIVIATLKILIIPLALGLIIRHFADRKIKKIEPVFPALSILCIILIIACVTALNQALLFSFPVMIFTAVILHNSLGLTLGYFIARALKADYKEARTLAFEVGLQNSGLGASLAASFFSAATALPSTIFSIWHNLSGIFMAKYWAAKEERCYRK